MRKWRRSGAAAQQAGAVVTPMPGRIVKVWPLTWFGSIWRGLARAAARCPTTQVSASQLPLTVHRPGPTAPLQVFVSANVSVQEGDPLVVVEAMKMEHTGQCERNIERRTARMPAGSSPVVVASAQQQMQRAEWSGCMAARGMWATSQSTATSGVAPSIPCQFSTTLPCAQCRPNPTSLHTCPQCARPAPALSQSCTALWMHRSVCWAVSACLV